MRAPELLKSHRNFRTHAIPLTILVLAWGLFFWRIITPVPSDHLTFQQGDFTLQFLAYRQMAFRQITNGHFPAFEECIYSGYPFQADPQSQVLYPPVAASMLLGKVIGWSSYPLQALEWEVLLHILLALLGMYAFLCQMRLHPLAAVFGAITFGFGGFLTGYAILQTAILETAAWLPLVLLFLLRLASFPASTPSRKWVPDAVILTFTIYCSYTAGHPQTLLFIVYTSIAAFIYWSWRHQQRIQQVLFRGGFIALAALMLSAAQLIPSLSFMLASTRSYLPFTEAGTGFALQDTALFVLTGITNVWQPLYVGIPALVMAVGALLVRKSESRFWLAVAVVALVLSFGMNAFGFDLAYLAAPGYKQFHSQERHAVIVAAALSILAGIGLNSLLCALRSRLRHRLWKRSHTVGWLSMFVFILLITVVTYTRAVAPDRVELGAISERIALLAISLGLTTLLLAWRTRLGRTSRAIWALVFLAVVCFDLFSANRYAATQPMADPFPTLKLAQPIQQANDIPIELRQNGAYRLNNHYGLPLNGACVNGLNEISGGSPIVLQFYREFLTRAPEDVLSRLLNVHYTVTWRGGMGTDNGKRIPYQKVATDKYQNIDANTFWLNWPSPGAQPVWITSKISFADNPDQLYARLQADDYDPANEAILYALDRNLVQQSSSGSAALEGKANGYMKIKANATGPALLVISEAYHWNWIAVVNGVEVKPVLTDGALLGVPIGSGFSTIELSYRPTDFYIGAGISGVTFLILAISMLVSLRLNQGTRAGSWNTPSARSSQ